MATVRSDGKERRARSPPAATVPLPRSRSSNSPSSPNARPSSDKAKPNYLKPTFCSCSSPGSNSCKQVQPGKKRCCTCTPYLSQSGQSTKPLSRIKSMEKPPSGPSHRPPARTLTFNSTKDKALLKSPSSSFASMYKVAEKPVVMKSSGRKNTSSIARGRSQTVKKGSNSVSLSLTSGVVTSTRAMEEAMEAIKSEPELIVHVVSQPELQQLKCVEEEEEEQQPQQHEEGEEVKTSEGEVDFPSAELRSDGKEEPQQKTNGEEVKGVEEDKNRNKEAAYNDVIEETATKLAVAEKKNKVLALVGAFETVISLQEPETPRTPRTPQQQQDTNETENFKNDDNALSETEAINATGDSTDVE